MLKRISLLAILLAAFLLLAACSDDLPTDTTGCNANPDGRVYSRDAGCVNGSISAEGHGEGEESGEGEEHSEDESVEPASSEEHEDAPAEEHEAEPTAEATEAATAEPNN